MLSCGPHVIGYRIRNYFALLCWLQGQGCVAGLWSRLQGPGLTGGQAGVARAWVHAPDSQRARARRC